MYDTVNNTNVEHIRHVAKIQRFGELHMTKAKALAAKARSEATRIKGEAIVGKKKGITVISNSIGEPPATPLLFAKHDQDTTEGANQENTQPTDQHGYCW